MVRLLEIWENVMTFQDPVRLIESRAILAGLTLRQLAALAGLAQTTITRWRQGHDPSMRLLRKLDATLEKYESHEAAE